MANGVAAQDPGELFDVVRADGSPTGVTKPRAAVHRDGDWHRSIHVWIAGVGEDGEPFLVFQRRSGDKDTWPGRLDATVGGHYRSGETVRQTLRETEEEIGVSVSLADLRPLGVRVCANEGESGIVDRELQDVFLLPSDRPLTDYRPNPAELAALIRVPIGGVLALFVGDAAEIPAECLAPGAEGPAPTTVGLDDFIPNIDRYFYRVAIAAGLVLRQERHVAV
ncbi:MAG TPA: NUDIX domain-containing protein [Thermomicrobiales bacterium]|jgi:isopentenyldiphosphate isomerase